MIDHNGIFFFSFFFFPWAIPLKHKKKYIRRGWGTPTNTSKTIITVQENKITNKTESLFSEQYNWRPMLDGLAFNSLAKEEASRLQLPF
jgi:hypothetical protein